MTSAPIPALIDELGAYWDREPFALEMIDAPIRRLNKDIWPPEVRAEIEAIYATPGPLEGGGEGRG